MLFFRGSDAVWNLTKSLIRSRLYEGSTGNSLFSPISILTALNILLLGTTGEIQQEMISTLGIYILCDVMVMLWLLAQFCTFRLSPVHGSSSLSVPADYKIYERGYRCHYFYL